MCSVSLHSFEFNILSLWRIVTVWNRLVYYLLSKMFDLKFSGFNNPLTIGQSVLRNCEINGDLKLKVAPVFPQCSQDFLLKKGHHSWHEKTGGIYNSSWCYLYITRRSADLSVKHESPWLGPPTTWVMCWGPDTLGVSVIHQMRQLCTRIYYQ